jgi:hypothetical protein
MSPYQILCPHVVKLFQSVLYTKQNYYYGALMTKKRETFMNKLFLYRYCTVDNYYVDKWCSYRMCSSPPPLLPNHISWLKQYALRLTDFAWIYNYYFIYITYLAIFSLWGGGLPSRTFPFKCDIRTLPVWQGPVVQREKPDQPTAKIGIRFGISWSLFLSQTGTRRNGAL